MNQAYLSKLGALDVRRLSLDQKIETKNQKEEDEEREVQVLTELCN